MNATLEIAKLCRMENKADIRRKNLAKWFETRSRPEDEKSYISQLINGTGSFGEKAARRLEGSYGMPPGYLDQEEGKLAAIPSAPPKQEPSFDDAIELIALFQAATVEGRKAILDTARSAADLASSNWRRVANGKR